LSDNSDHSELTPRGDGIYKRRQNGPRGYGQGRLSSKASNAVGQGPGGGSVAVAGAGSDLGAITVASAVGSVGVGVSGVSVGGNISKPTKYKFQGGQRPLKIAVKSASDISSIGNSNRNDPIGMLIAQAYPNSVGVGIQQHLHQQPLLSGNNGEQLTNQIGAILLPVDKGNNVGMRNRSLPMLQQNNKSSNTQLQIPGT